LVKGVSTLYDADGVMKAQWVKTNVDREKQLEALKEVIDALKADLPRGEPVSAPTQTSPELCNLFTFTDYHLGMLAWHREGGEDWDLEIAESVINRSMASMIGRSPAADTAVVNIQGDFLHTDGKIPVTPAHGHVLDADSRYPKIRKAAIRIIRNLVKMCLEAHQNVHLVIAEGNHDEEGTGWLADSTTGTRSRTRRFRSCLPLNSLRSGAGPSAVKSIAVIATTVTKRNTTALPWSSTRPWLQGTLTPLAAAGLRIGPHGQSLITSNMAQSVASWSHRRC